VSATGYNYVLLAIVAVLAIATYLVTRRVGRAPSGRALRALRENEAASLSLGKHVTRQRTHVFILAAFIIGIVAPAYVWYIRSISPSLFTADITFTAWTALVIGGIGSFRGPALGAFVLILLTQATQFLQVAPEHAALLASMQPLIVGLGLIIVLRIRPQGLITERRDFERVSRSRPRPSGAAASRPAPEEVPAS
jgi:branched-chain amino acid transport system permease protein